MSELYSVRVAAFDGEHVALELTTVHLDAGPPPATASFALNLLLDLWRLLGRGYTVLLRGSGLSEHDAIALAAREPWGRRLERLDQLSNGEELEATHADLDALRAWTLGPRMFRGRRVLDWGTSGDLATVTVEGDYDAYVEEADRLIGDVAVTDVVHAEAYDAWPPYPYDDPRPELVRAHDEARPRATLRFRAPPELVGWLRAGWSFDTAVWR